MKTMKYIAFLCAILPGASLHASPMDRAQTVSAMVMTQVPELTFREIGVWPKIGTTEIKSPFDRADLYLTLRRVDASRRTGIAESESMVNSAEMDHASWGVGASPNTDMALVASIAEIESQVSGAKMHRASWGVGASPKTEMALVENMAGTESQVGSVELPLTSWWTGAFPKTGITSFKNLFGNAGVHRASWGVGASPKEAVYIMQ